MDNTFSGYTRRDWCIAGLLVFVILLLAGTQITYGMASWGDDFAAYLAEGISISEGTFEEQTVKNFTLHPTQLAAEAEEGRLVYVWGFPLLLSLVHRLVGFDLVNYGSIVYYKLPSLLAFALMAGVLYLFYRRYFTELPAGFLTLIFLASGDMIEGIDYLTVDIVFLFWFLSSLLLAECFFDSVVKAGRERTAVFLAIGLGVCLWFTYETRLNGQTVLIVVLLSHGIRLLQNRQKLSGRKVLLNGLPYILFLLLKVVTEAIWLPATPNISDIGALTFQGFLFNCQYYCTLTKEYLRSMTGETDLFIWPVLAVFLLIGLFRDGLSRRNFPFTILLVGTYAVLLLLPYTQGLRYMYNALPVMLLYAATGGQRVVRWLLAKRQLKYARQCICVLALLILTLAYIPQIRSSAVNLAAGRSVSDANVYSEEAIEVYHYIRENVPQEDVIAFVKPRALYLNTGRVCVRLDVNGHKLEDADYYLFYQHMHGLDDLKLLEDRTEELQLVYENPVFCLYEILK